MGVSTPDETSESLGIWGAMLAKCNVLVLPVSDRFDDSRQMMGLGSNLGGVATTMIARDVASTIAPVRRDCEKTRWRGISCRGLKILKVTLKRVLFDEFAHRDQLTARAAGDL